MSPLGNDLLGLTDRRPLGEHPLLDIYNHSPTCFGLYKSPLHPTDAEDNSWHVWFKKSLVAEAVKVV